MRIFEIYTKELVLREFWDTLGENLELNENDADLDNLLNKADELIFNKFGINPTEKAYFIAGSARLYLYPKLREAFNLEGNIGDLDVIIPNKEHWVRAGLEEQWNAGGIYRPTTDGSIEAFNIWAPNKTGEQYADVRVRPTNTILMDSGLIKGHYFMSLGDIMDYKTSLHRNKERDVVSLITQYQQQNVYGKSEFLKRIARLIGLNKTKEFLGVVNK